MVPIHLVKVPVNYRAFQCLPPTSSPFQALCGALSMRNPALVLITGDLTGLFVALIWKPSNFPCCDCLPSLSFVCRVLAVLKVSKSKAIDLFPTLPYFYGYCTSKDYCVSAVSNMSMLID